MPMENHPSHELSEVMEVASEAGHILLENGAEIARVEDIMSRIANYYGVDSGNFFVLSNGIFTTGSTHKLSKAGAQVSSYANVEFIPLKGIQLSKVKAVNRLSYDIAADKCTLEEARERLHAIRTAPAKPAWEQMLGAAFGASGFTIMLITLEIITIETAIDANAANTTISPRAEITRESAMVIVCPVHINSPHLLHFRFTLLKLK